MSAKDSTGQRRLDDANDFVRLETISALKRDIPVVPVLVQAAVMPRKEQLPPEMEELAYRNAVELTHARWTSDVQVLIQALEEFVKKPAAPVGLHSVAEPVAQADLTPQFASPLVSPPTSQNTPTPVSAGLADSRCSITTPHAPMSPSTRWASAQRLPVGSWDSRSSWPARG